MTGAFGFIPPAAMAEQLKAMLDPKSTNQPLSKINRDLANSVGDELVNVLLVQMLQAMPDSDRKEYLLKFTDFVKVSISKLLGLLIEDKPDAHFTQTVAFNVDRCITDKEGQMRFGLLMSDTLYNQVKSSLEVALAGKGETIRPQMKEALKLFVNELIEIFLVAYPKTLGLGIFKRNAVNVSSAALRTGIHVAVNRMIDTFNNEELQFIANNLDQYFFVV